MCWPSPSFSTSGRYLPLQTPGHFLPPSHLPEKTGVTQDTFPQPLRQHFIRSGHWLSTWHWSRQRPSGVKGRSTLGQEPGFSAEKKEWGVGWAEGNAQRQTRIHSLPSQRLGSPWEILPTPSPPPQTPLPQAPSSTGFRITGPQGESQLCLSLTLWPGPETSQSRCCTLGAAGSAARITGCCNSNGGDIPVLILPEKPKSFAIIIKTSEYKSSHLLSSFSVLF